MYSKIYSDCPWQVFVSVAIMNSVAISLSFGSALCLKLKRQSAVSVAIESSNQNAPLAAAIVLLSLDKGYQRDLALNVPVIYMLTNVLFVLVFGITLRRTGWLQIDEEDGTMTLGKIIRNFRKNREQNSEENVLVDNVSERSNGDEHPIELDPQDSVQ